MVNQMKKDMKMDRWMHMPQTSYEYGMYSIIWGIYETPGYDFWGCLFVVARLKQAARQRSQTTWRIEISIIWSTNIGAKNRNKIIMLRGHFVKFDEGEDTDHDAPVLWEYPRFIYEHNIKKSGLPSLLVLTSEFHYVHMLFQSSHFLKAEQLMDKLSALSLHVHGPRHTWPIFF